MAKKVALFNQSNLLGKWWGNFKLIAQHANIYVQLFILSFSGVAAYAVVRDWAAEIGYNLSFWQFALGTVIIVGMMSLFEWKLGLPSLFAAWNTQMWEHKNPMREKLEEIERKIDRLKNDETK